MRKVGIIGSASIGTFYLGDLNTVTLLNPERNTSYKIMPYFDEMNDSLQSIRDIDPKQKKFRKSNNRKKTKYRVKNK